MIIAFTFTARQVNSFSPSLAVTVVFSFTARQGNTHFIRVSNDYITILNSSNIRNKFKNCPKNTAKEEKVSKKYRYQRESV